MRLRRLYQPRKPAFWLMVVLNALSMGLMWIVQTYALTPFGQVVVVLLVLGNAALGLFLMWQLLRPE